MEDKLYPASIIKDFKFLMAFGARAATVVDKKLINLRYQKHVPHMNRVDNSSIWTRDRWFAFDSLPRDLRDEVNYDPRDPNEALKAATELWEADKKEADRAAVRVANYESLLSQMSGEDEGARIIRQMIEERLAENRRLEAERLAAEEARRKAEEERAKREAKRRRRWVPPTEMVEYRINGQRLRDISRNVSVIDTRGIPPHLIYAAERAKMMERLKVTEHRYTRPGFYADSTEKDRAKKMDQEAPVKIHPVQLKRGRNF